MYAAKEEDCYLHWRRVEIIFNSSPINWLAHAKIFALNLKAPYQDFSCAQEDRIFSKRFFYYLALSGGILLIALQFHTSTDESEYKVVSTSIGMEIIGPNQFLWSSPSEEVYDLPGAIMNHSFSETVELDSGLSRLIQLNLSFAVDQSDLNHGARLESYAGIESGTVVFEKSAVINEAIRNLLSQFSEDELTLDINALASIIGPRLETALDTEFEDSRLTFAHLHRVCVGETSYKG